MEYEDPQVKNLISKMGAIKIDFIRPLTVKEYIDDFNIKRSRLLTLKPDGIFENFDNFIKEYKERLKKNMYSYMYEFKFVYHEQVWKIRRTLKDFNNLVDMIDDDYQIKFKKSKSEDHNVIGEDVKKTIEKILKEPIINRKISTIHRFFEISLFNFANMEENIVKQVVLPKKSGGKKKKQIWRKFLTCFDPWLDRWFVFTNEGIGYMTRNTKKNKLFREYNFFSKNIKIELTTEDIIIIKFQIRKFELRVKKDLCMIDLAQSILDAYLDCPILIENRFESFCQIIPKNNVHYYVNGSGTSNYMTDIYEELLKAKKEVLINDWFFSPQIYLKRPIEDYPESRMDMVLSKLAKRGVNVYIILYREMEEALYNNSNYAKRYLNKVHQNIHVVRHPRFFIHFWSHHEKMVIIDSKVCFMGGIDLCFGRYEEPRYPLKEPIDGKTFWKGQDYSNPRIYDFEDVDKWDNCLIDKKKDPRMPWRDIAIRMRGDIVKGMKKHFLEFWNFNNIQFAYKRSILKNVTEDDIIADSQFTKRNRMTIVQDNIKDLKKDLLYKEKEEDNLEDSKIQGMSKALNMLSKKHKPNQSFFYFEDNDEVIEEEENEDDDDFKEIVLTNNKGIIEGDHDTENDFLIQGLRSGSNWSIGLPLNHHEHSIQNAYLHLIENAKKFIYIENQFFISSTANEKEDLVKNTIVEVLAQRIIKAIDNDEKFLVFITLPLLPGFGGNITKKDGQLLRIQIEWHLNTIFKSENSLIKQIEARGVPWKNHIRIFGLRNHAIMDNEPKSEIVYVHSKLLIIDDDIALLGSANLNDRSMTGVRDSELAVVMEESNKEEGILGGEKIMKSKKVKEFRIEALKSIFEINEFKGEKISYEDPLDPLFLEAVDEQTEINEDFYWNVFGFYPHNSLKTLKMIEEKQKDDKVNSQFYYENKHKVKGFAQPYPFKFLENEESLTSKFLDIGTTLLPQSIFT